MAKDRAMLAVDSRDEFRVLCDMYTTVHCMPVHCTLYSTTYYTRFLSSRYCVEFGFELYRERGDCQWMLHRIPIFEVSKSTLVDLR